MVEEKLKTESSKLKANRKWVGILFFAVGIILLNVLAQYFYTRFDFTKEKRYTLTQKTKDNLAKTTTDITITVFLDGEMPSAFKRLQNAIKDLLNDYKAYSKAKMKIVFVDPLKDIPAADRDTIIANLAQDRINPTVVKITSDAGSAEKIIFPMALIQYDGKQIAVDLVQKSAAIAKGYDEIITNSIQNLEYTFTSGLKRLMLGRSPKIGFTEGHGEPSDLRFDDAIHTLSQNFIVGRIDLNKINKQFLDSIDVIFIAKPQQPFTEAEKYKINYFVMKGGKLVWSIDQARAELDSLGNHPQILAVGRELNLDDMLFEYGARINYDLITDVNCALIPVASGDPNRQAQMNNVPFLYYPILLPDTVSSVVKNIGGIRSEFASTVDTIGVPNVKKQLIFRSSPYRKVFELPKVLSLQVLSQQPVLEEYLGKPETTGVLLEGSFKSVFLNRAVPEGITEKYDVPVHSKPTKMIVIGDGDIFTNQINRSDGSPFPLGEDPYTQQNFGNKALLLNIADYFTDDDNLIALRNKEIKVRLLDKTRIRLEKTKWQTINTIFPLLLLICFAIFQHYYRKRKYAK
jgi:ABC-2 type transport system permease protein